MKDHLSTLQQELEAGTAQLVDVREQAEWDAGHLKSAKLSPLSDLESGEFHKELDKNLKTYLHCRSGNRVHMAAPIMEDLGFETVIPLSEGFDELVGEGFEEGE